VWKEGGDNSVNILFVMVVMMMGGTVTGKSKSVIFDQNPIVANNRGSSKRGNFQAMLVCVRDSTRYKQLPEQFCQSDLYRGLMARA
jgi:hypothetical protein